MAPQSFEDFNVGDRFTGVGITLSEAQILDFALTYDPQPFHINKEAAERDYPYAGLIASGFQTLAVHFRSVYQTGFLVAGMGAPGMEDVRWLLPVRPGDTLTGHAEVLETRMSSKRPDRGYLKTKHWTTNQHGETVMDYEATIIVRTQAGQTGLQAAS